MGRSSKEFYHGSAHPFNVGDVVSPQGDEPYSYATEHMYVADTIARMRGGKMYSVSRVDPKELSSDSELSSKQAEIRAQGKTHSVTQISKKGFKVTKVWDN
jgi:hypothetical protein